MDGERATFLPEDVVVERDVASDWLVASDGPYVAALDPRLDDGLRREGLAREVVNRVQRLRKEAGYVYTDRIGLWIAGAEPVLEAVRATRRSSRARRWPAGWSSAGGRRRPTSSRKSRSRDTE